MRILKSISLTAALLLGAGLSRAQVVTPAQDSTSADRGIEDAIINLKRIQDELAVQQTPEQDAEPFDIHADEDASTVIVRLKKEQDRIAAERSDPKRRDGRNPQWSVALNIADGFTFGTMGISLQRTLTRHVTLDVKARYNPWTWNIKESKQFQYRHQTYSVGARWWPWYTFSGWWVSGALQYQQYNRAGIGVEYAREGDAYGAAFNAGYAVQIWPWFNMDFGLGFFTGYQKFVKYACPVCGKRIETGEGFFILPDFITISAMFVF